MTIKAIPTRYAGVQFRSRLEARWAAFFDLVGWRWQYEPFDLNGWIPDFALIGHKTTLVEVKPVDEGSDLLAATQAEIARANPGQEVLILSYFTPITQAEHWDNTPILGWLYESWGDIDAPCWEWGLAAVSTWVRSPALGFCSESGSYVDRISGEYSGNIGGDIYDVAVASTLRNLWAEAGNMVQWRSPVVYGVQS